MTLILSKAMQLATLTCGKTAFLAILTTSKSHQFSLISETNTAIAMILGNSISSAIENNV